MERGMIDSLSREELLQLKEEINVKLLEDRTLSSLKMGDDILGIRLSFGPHTMTESINRIGEVDIVDYCKITHVELPKDGESDLCSIGVSHPSLAFGVNTSISLSDMQSEHCFLCIGPFKSGYDSFFTMRPKTWREDLRRLGAGKLEVLQARHRKELEVCTYKLTRFETADLSHLNHK